MTRHDPDVVAPSTSPADRVARRSFLLASATVVAGVAVAGRSALRHRADRSLAAMAAAPGPKLSVGFVDTAATGGTIDWTARPDVMAAHSVRAAHLPVAIGSVEGTTPGAAVDHHLDVLLDAGGDQPPHRFAAWSVVDGVASHAVEFTAPTGDLAFGFELQTAESARHTVMTRSTTSKLPSLAVGTYLIALAPDVWESASRLPAPADPVWDDLASIVVRVRHT